MAKNLKITVKNAQLAEALKKFKKPEAAKVVAKPPKETAPTEEKKEPVAAAPTPEAAPIAKPAPREVPRETPREVVREVPKEIVPEESFEAEPAPEKSPERPPERPLGPRLDRPRPSGDRPPFKSHRPGAGPRTFSDGPRPAYQPRGAGAPPAQTGGYHGSGGYRPKPTTAAGTVPEGYKPRPPGSPPYQPGAGGYRPRPPGGPGGSGSGRPADTDPIPQEDLPEVLLAVLLERRPSMPMDTRPGTKPSSREHAPAKTREEEAARKFKDVKDIKAQKSLKSSAPLIRAINKAFVMKTMKAGAHAKAAATNGCRAWAKSSLFALKL